MADDNSSILSEFEEFLKARDDAKRSAEQQEDEEIEIWDEHGRGARVRRSRAKPFLQSLGIDLDAEPSGEGSDPEAGESGGGSAGTSRKSSGKKSASVASSGIARKYFTPKR